MINEQETSTDLWLVKEDVPARDIPRLAFLIDGRMTMLEMCLSFLCAKHSIYITAWGLSPELLLVRGKHKCAGQPGTAEQEDLLAWLRAKGLTEDEVLFWQNCEELSVTNILSYAVNKGVDVRVLLWDTYTLPFHPSPKNVQKILEPLGVSCLLDDSHMGLLNHPLVAHHQKTAVIDSRLAFVGGIDVMVESNGDNDRWDTKGHPFHTPLRLDKDGKMPHSWHDVHVLFEGPAVADVEHNFRQRWNAVVELHSLDTSLLLPEPTPQLPKASPKPTRSASTGNPVYLQVIRTIPKAMYSFTQQDGIATILETYQHAFAQAKRFIYIENQYLWRRTFLGFENPALGVPHADMENLLQSLAEALARGVIVTIILPDNPNVGREFTDEGLKYLWELAPRAVASGALQAYTLASSLQKQDQTSYRSIYVHAKTTIIDDLWVTLGSANLNNRGMRDDSELNVALMYPEMAQNLRILLMAEHLGMCDADILFRILEIMGRVKAPEGEKIAPPILSLKQQVRPRRLRHPNTRMFSTTSRSIPMDDQITGELGSPWRNIQSQLADPFSGLALLVKQARENFLAIKAGQPLQGHLLPYIRHDQAQEFEIEVNAVSGWLDTLSSIPEEKTDIAATADVP